MLNREEQICLKVELKSMSTAIDYFIFSCKLIRDFSFFSVVGVVVVVAVVKHSTK